ncbi:RHS repeat-associated core domain-containing protein, partial [Aeromonas sp. S12(2024)]|uniref:RHS repeat-associated core domain-containing protein n=1 Tax=Aeromonas sp. S12(2024) TaxID=3242885 RepID=UPI00352938BB
YGYRYYQPWVGRWLNADPAGTVDGLNLYRMVRNNPVKFMDNTGLNGEGFLYAPFSSPDVVIQAATHNIRREQSGKSPRVLISQNSQDRISLEQYRSNQIATRNAMIQKIQGTMNDIMQMANVPQDQIANFLGVDTFNEMMSNMNRLKGQVNALNQLSITSNTILSTLSSAQQHKLYILGHGGPGKNFLAADQDMAMGMATASEVARQLATGGLEKEFIDIRALACNSADTREPRSFQGNDLMEASLPITKRTGLFGLFGKKRVVAEPFAQTLSNELSREGFGQAKVSGYHGAGVTFSNNHHMRRLLNGQTPDVRASSVRRQF